MTTAISRAERQAVLDQVNRLAYLLDNSIQIPLINYRIGIEAIIGLIPVLGDAIGMLISGFIVLQAARVGVSRTVITRMLINIALEGIIGSIPLIGDVFDAVFKANVRNARLLRQALR